MRGPDLRRPSLRLTVLRGALCVGLLAVCARAAHLALIDERGPQRAHDQIVSEIPLPPVPNRSNVTAFNRLQHHRLTIHCN